jgi:hypothetical protein
VTYLKVFRILKSLPQLLKPLLSGLLWYTERSGESDPTIILVQGVGDKVQVFVFVSPDPIV